MTNGNDSAFATPTVYGPDEDHPNMIAAYESGADGLTKREYFAAMAMQGLLACPDFLTAQDAADVAVEYAVALIDSLNKESNA